jgi:D-alanine-D-alanine ligase
VTGARPRVAVLYNAPVLPPGHPDGIAEADVVDVARTVAESLARHHFEPVLVPATPPVDLTLARLRDARPEVVFNLIEGFGGSSIGANVITGLIELSGLPFTGCPADALTWCLSKGRTKALLRGLGLPTASFALAEPGDPVPSWDGPWPVFVKPDAEDASLGIDQGSVAADGPALAERVARLRARHGGRVLVESYLPGREFNVGLLSLPEPEPLPIAEVLYRPAPGTWPILTYDAKWAIGSVDDLSSPIGCPASIDPGLAGSLGRLAVAAYRATGCRDYARVDFRLDDRGAPMILEVNPNPDIGPSAGWARALRVSGRDYAETLARLVGQALRRPHPGEAAARDLD